MLTQYSLIKPMLDILFLAEERRLAKAIDQLHLINVEACKQQLDGFMYNGKFYRWSQAAKGAGARRTLHLSLWPDMDKILADTKQCVDDKDMIKQLLVRLYDACHNDQDIRCATPEPIVDVLPEHIRSLERIRQPGFFIFTHGDLKLYAKVMPKIEFYSASRLIY